MFTFLPAAHCVSSMSQARAQRSKRVTFVTTLNETAVVVRTRLKGELSWKLVCPVTGPGDCLVQGQGGKYYSLS